MKCEYRQQGRASGLHASTKNAPVGGASFFLRQGCVYSALSSVLQCLLPLGRSSPQVPCFKTLTEEIKKNVARMPVYVADWLQTALQAGCRLAAWTLLMVGDSAQPCTSRGNKC